MRESFFLFILFRREKNESRKAADCTSAAKLASLLPKRCKTTASRSYWCSAFNGKTSQSFHAAPVRSDFGCAALSVLTSGALIKSGKFLEKRGAPIRAPKGVVLRPSQKRERFLAEDVQTAALLLFLFFELQRRKE